MTNVDYSSTSPEAERKVGVRGYLTETPGLGGRIKVEPQDFVVSELTVYVPPSRRGSHTAALVRAENWETNHLVEEMGRLLGLPRGKIRFAGMKDKRSVSTQMVQIDASVDRVKSLRLPRVELLDAYTTYRKIDVGDLRGNRFQVRIRETDTLAKHALRIAKETRDRLMEVGGFPNFFGPQRFGSLKQRNHVVGQHMVHGELREAVEAVVETDAPPAENSSRPRESEKNTHGITDDRPTAGMTREESVLDHLRRNPEDYAGALRVLPLNLRLLFVHAYQSFLFNEILSRRMEDSLPLDEPLVGDAVIPRGRFGVPDRKRHERVTEENLGEVQDRCRRGESLVAGSIVGTKTVLAEGEMGEIERSVLEEEGVEPGDFYVEEMPRLTSKGENRELLAPLSVLALNQVDSDLLLGFDLTKGCYATSLLREFTK